MYKKKGPVWKYSPFLNPISYEKPNRILQAACRGRALSSLLVNIFIRAVNQLFRYRKFQWEEE
jgi:hypothetical protein